MDNPNCVYCGIDDIVEHTTFQCPRGLPDMEEFVKRLKCLQNVASSLQIEAEIRWIAFGVHMHDLRF